MFNNLNTLKPFFEQPRKEYSVRDTAKLMKKSPATTSKILKELYTKNILKYRREKITDYYSADTDSETYKDIKRYYNIRKLRESGVLDAFDKTYFKPTIILYGSMSKGMDTEDSDIDMLIISEKHTEFAERKKYEKILGKEIQLMIVKNLKDIKNPHLINSILNGTIIQGEIVWT